MAQPWSIEFPHLLLGPATKLEITVRAPAAHHTLTVTQLHKWVNSLNTDAGDVLKVVRGFDTTRINAAALNFLPPFDRDDVAVSAMSRQRSPAST